MNLTGRPPLGLKEPKPKKAPDHMARVADLPCVICAVFREPQMSPTEVHHVIHDRHGNKKSPDTETIPLCHGHHTGLMDGSKLALHPEPEAWRQRYGADHSWLDWVRDRLQEEDDALDL